MFLSELTKLNGVSGNERQIRNYIIDKLNVMNCEYVVDRVGNVIAHNIGKKINDKIMLSAHMDEAGFVVSYLEKNGFLRIRNVGNMDIRTLNSKVVNIGQNNIKGVLGSKSVHMMKAEEKGKEIPIENLFIDIGCNTKEEADNLVSLGDYITIQQDTKELGENLILGKALDSRASCSIVLNLLNQKLDIDYYAAFTVLKEVGCIGAKCASYTINPDLAIVIDGVLCADLPGVKDKVSELGQGTGIVILDDKNIYSQELIQGVINIANENKLKYQVLSNFIKENEAGIIRVNKNGCQVITLGIPCKYKNTPINIIHKGDYETTSILVKEIISRHE